MKKRLSSTLILGAAALAYLLSGETPPLIQEAPTEAGGEQAIPQSYARGVSMREFDPEGVLRDRTDADELRRYPQQQLVELDAPKRWHYANEGPWQASAETGVLYERREHLHLTDNVQLRYDTEGVEFLTQSMILDLRQRKARSETPARAWQDGSVMLGDRLFVDLDRQLATLTGSVRTVYEPE